MITWAQAECQIWLQKLSKITDIYTNTSCQWVFYCFCYKSPTLCKTTNTQSI